MNSIRELLDTYKVDDIVYICPDCNDWANSKKKILDKALIETMRISILDRRGGPIPHPAVLAWKRFVRTVKTMFSV